MGLSYPSGKSLQMISLSNSIIVGTFSNQSVEEKEADVKLTVYNGNGKVIQIWGRSIQMNFVVNPLCLK